jgi:hypothetical protein
MHARIRRMEDKSSLSRFPACGRLRQPRSRPDGVRMGVHEVRIGVVQAPRFFRPQLCNSIWDRSAKLSGFYRSGARHISATDLTQYLSADLIVRVFFVV